MNLDFKNNNYRFNARASVIIFNADKTKILLFRVEDGRDYYMLPGGRIEIFEDSKSAIAREVREELGYELDFDLCSVQENFITKDNQKDNDNQQFYWVDINEISKYKIYPESTYKLLGSDKIKHFIEKKNE